MKIFECFKCVFGVFFLKWDGVKLVKWLSEMKFMSRVFEFVQQMKLQHSFTQKHSEHADLLVTWLFSHLFLLNDKMLD